MARRIQVPNGGFESGVFPPWRDVGRTSIGTTPRTGRYNAFMIARPFETASIATRVNLGPPEPQGLYSLVFFASRGTIATTGTLVVSFTSSTKPPLIIPLSNVPLVRQYGLYVLAVPVNALRSRNTDIRFELNGGRTTTSVLIDDVQIVAT